MRNTPELGLYRESAATTPRLWRGILHGIIPAIVLWALIIAALALMMAAAGAQPAKTTKGSPMTPLLPVTIEAIPNDQQRYPTAGDYWIKDGTLDIRVSKMSDPRYEFLIALHELVEAELVRQRGISMKSIDDFDMAYEKNRKTNDDSEPGDDPKAPYHLEHVFATKIEKLMAKQLGVDWKTYDAAVDALP